MRIQITQDWHLTDLRQTTFSFVHQKSTTTHVLAKESFHQESEISPIADWCRMHQITYEQPVGIINTILHGQLCHIWHILSDHMFLCVLGMECSHNDFYRSLIDVECTRLPGWVIPWVYYEGQLYAVLTHLTDTHHTICPAVLVSTPVHQDFTNKTDC